MNDKDTVFAVYLAVLQCAELVRAEEGCASTFYLSVDKGKCRCVLKGQECQLDKSENAKGITVYRFGVPHSATPNPMPYGIPFVHVFAIPNDSCAFGYTAMEFKMNDKFERVTQPGKDIERKDKVPEKKKPGPQMSWDIKASLFLMFVALLLVVAIFMPTSKVAKSADDSSGPQVKDITSIVEAASRAIDDADASAIAHGEAENAPIVYRDHSPASLGPAENVNSGTDESRSVQDEREADTSERSGEEGFTTVAADAYCMGSWGVHRRQLDDASSAEQVPALKLDTLQ
eukprot:gene28714-35631_t